MIQNGFSWTTDKPTKPGWYWYRGSVSKGNAVITHVYDSKNGICAAFMNDFWEEVGLISGEWAGPLEEPK